LEHQTQQPVITTPGRLVAVLEEEVGRIPAPLGKQIDALSELFERFTSDRSGLRKGSYLDDPRLRTAYLRYHLPLNVARAAWVIRDLVRIHPALGELREVIDLGAGLGSASLATFFGLGESVPRRFRLFDKSRAALKTARRILESCSLGSAESIETAESRLPSIPEVASPSIVWLSMVLNELSSRDRAADDRRESTLRRLAETLPPRSVLIVMEPALREPGRALLTLHDEALATGDWRVLAPCTHQRRCPLLRLRDRSWCHFKLVWDAPPVVREVADPLGLDHTLPAFSYVALERLPPGARLPPSSPEARVIGDPMRVQGGKRGVYVCRDGSRDAIEVSRSVRRGDILAGYSARQAGVPHSSSPPERSGSQASGGDRGRPPWKRKARR